MKVIFSKIFNSEAKLANTRGKHLLLELYDCERKKLDDEDYLKKILAEAAIKAKATILGSVSHKFDPQGVTILILLAESHISIHTWPEHRYAAVDLFSCSKDTEYNEVSNYLTKMLDAKKAKNKLFDRGGHE